VAVTALWEKPDALTAKSLYERGCLWNTFILVGAVSAFVRLVHDTRPELELFFPRAKESLSIDDIFRQIEPVDFSHEVIVPSGSKLRTVCLGDVGWSDLGEPERAMAIMLEHGTPEQKALASALLLQSSAGGP
jgi:mannose-1-phosphate guanylyltransferase